MRRRRLVKREADREREWPRDRFCGIWDCKIWHSIIQTAIATRCIHILGMRVVYM